MNTQQSKFNIGACLFVFFFQVLAFAAQEQPQTFTLDGVLYSGTSSATPLASDPSVLFKIQILSSGQDCILYEEQQTAATNSSGQFSINVGSRTGAAKRTGGVDPGNTMAKIFQNAAMIPAATGSCAGNQFDPTALQSPVRYLKITVTPSTTGIADTFTNALRIDSVPSTMVAETLQGYGPSSFLMARDDASYDLNQNNLESLFTVANFAELTALLAGSSSNYVSKTAAASIVLPTYAGNPASPTAGSFWYDSSANAVKYSIGGGAPGIRTILGADPSGAVSTTTMTATNGSFNNLRIYRTDNAFKMTQTVPAGLAADYSLIWPGADGSANQVLGTNGAGQLQWQTIIGAATTTSYTFNSNSDNTGNDGGFNFQSNASNITTISNTGEVAVGVGTTNAPSLTFLGDTDTGWYHPAANTLAASTGGTERVRIDSSGRVGIGTNSATSNLSFAGEAAKTIGMERNSTAATAGQTLTIQAGGATSGGTDLDGGDLILASGTSTGNKGSNILFQTAGRGYPGSGTTDRTPATVMKIYNSGEVDINYTSMNSGSGYGNGLTIHNDMTSNVGTVLTMTKTRGGLSLVNNDTLGQFDMWGRDSLNSMIRMTQMRGQVTDVTNGAVSSSLFFSTMNAGTLNDRVTITNTSVGIGTTVPGTQLDVAGAITSRPSGTGAGQTGQLILRELAANGSSTFTIKAPDDLTASRNWILPDTNGSSGQFLQTDGSGNLTWAAAGGGSSQSSTTSFTFNSNSDASGSDGGFTFQNNAGTVFSIDNGGAATFSGTVTSTGLVSRTGGAAAALTNATSSDTTGVVADLKRERGDGTAPGANFAGLLTFSAEGFTNNSFPNVAGIKWGWEAAQSNDTTDRDGYLAFSTVINNGNSTTGGDERMRISSDGKVGIGTNSPSEVVSIMGNTSNVNAYLSIRPESTSGLSTGIYLKHPNGANMVNFVYLSNTDEYIQYTGGTTPFIWQTNGGSNERMRLTSTGLVGIGTNSPRAMLDVAGTVLSGPAGTTATTSVDFSNSNIQYTTQDCQTYNLNYMKDGGTYTFVVKGTTSTLCAFNAYSGNGTGALTMHLPTDHTSTTGGKHTIYTFMVVGGDVYTSWIPGM